MWFVLLLAVCVMFLMSLVPDWCIAAIPMWIVVSAFVLGNVTDGHSTVRFLKITRNVRSEGNFLARPFLRWFGFFWGVVIWKIAVVVPLFWLLFPDRRPLIVITIVLFLVSLNNYSVSSRDEFYDEIYGEW